MLLLLFLQFLLLTMPAQTPEMPEFNVRVYDWVCLSAYVCAGVCVCVSLCVIGSLWMYDWVFVCDVCWLCLGGQLVF